MLGGLLGGQLKAGPGRALRRVHAGTYARWPVYPLILWRNPTPTQRLPGHAPLRSRAIHGLYHHGLYHYRWVTPNTSWRSTTAQPSFCRIEPALPSKCWPTVSSGSSKMYLLTKSRCPMRMQPEGRGSDGADQCTGPGGMPYDHLCSVPLCVRKFDALLTLRLRCVWTASAYFFPQ